MKLPANLDKEIMDMLQRLTAYSQMYRALATDNLQKDEAIKTGDAKIKELLKELEQLKKGAK